MEYDIGLFSASKDEPTRTYKVGEKVSLFVIAITCFLKFILLCINGRKRSNTSVVMVEILQRSVVVETVLDELTIYNLQLQIFCIAYLPIII